MKLKQLLSLRKNELFIGSFILLILLNLSNVLNYVFHLFMARMLSPADYGVLAVLTSIIYIFTVPSLSLQTIVSKKVTEFHVRGDVAKLKGFFLSAQKVLLHYSIFLFICFSVLALLFFDEILGISGGLLLATGFVIFGCLLSPLALGSLQGMKKFSVFGYNQVIGSLLKLVIAVVLVSLGLRVYGAIIGFIIGILATFFIALPYLKEILHQKKSEPVQVHFFSIESLPTMLSILVLILMYSLDVILAKIFFPADLAGKYAVASMFGKLIFLGTLAVANALFPISSEKFLHKKRTSQMFIKTFFTIVLLCLVLILVYFLIPEFLISVLFGSVYVEIAPLLGYLGITFSLISLLNLVVFYKIATNKFRIVNAASLLFYLVLQVGLMSVYRQDIFMFTQSFMIAVAISFLGNLLLLVAQR